jgi:hypothetical protein
METITFRSGKADGALDRREAALAGSTQIRSRFPVPRVPCKRGA